MANQLKDLGDKGVSVGNLLDGFSGGTDKEQEKLLYKNKSALLSSDLKDVLAYFDGLIGPARGKMEEFIVKNFSTDDLDKAIDDTTRADLDGDSQLMLDRIQKERIDFLEHDRAERLESIKVMKGLLNVDERGETVLELLIEKNKKKLDEIKEIAKKIQLLNQEIREKELRGESFEDESNKLRDMNEALEKKKKELKDGLIPGLQDQKRYIYEIIRDNLGLNTSEVDFGDPLKTLSRTSSSIVATGVRDALWKGIKAFSSRITLNKLIKKLNGIKRPVDGVLLLFMPRLYTPGWDEQPYKHRQKMFKKWLRKNTGDWSTFEYEFDKRVSKYLKNLNLSLEEKAKVDLVKSRFEKIKQEFKKQLKEQYEASA